MLIEPLLQPYISIIKMLKFQFGDTCHATLYRFNKPEGEVVHSVGNLLYEQVGDPAPKYLLNTIQQENFHPVDNFGFINKDLNGYVLRTSHLFIYDEKEALAGCLSVHINIVHIKMMISFMEEFCRSSSLEDEKDMTNAHSDDSTTADSVQNFVIQAIDEFINKQLGLRNFATLEKQEKITLIAELDRKGIFAVKGAVNLVAERVKMSKYAIYNYLDEIRTNSFSDK